MKRNTKFPSGFTLIEVMMVVVVISILIGIGILIDNSTKNTYKAARDSERASDVESIAIEFESYYRNNQGRYPDTTQISDANIGNIVKISDLLSSPGTNVDNLIAATSVADVTASGMTAKDYVYQPITATNALCNSNALTCVRFNLYYEREVDNQVVKIESNRQQ